jgi:dimethylamine/trimethylamine dehydrogenase
VAMYLGNRLSAAEVREFAADHVLIATGARWRNNGVGRSHVRAIPELPAAGVLTPDDIMRGARPSGNVTIFDDDYYYMGPVIAVLLARDGAQVTYVTSAGRAGEWSHYTGEQDRTQQQLIELGIEVVVNNAVAAFDGEAVTLSCVYSGRERRHLGATLILVTSREPQDELYRELVGEEGSAPGLKVRRIGDCRQPALIAHAVFSGHEAAREVDQQDDSTAVPRDRSVISHPS